MGFKKKDMTLDEAEQVSESLDMELTIAKKRAMLKELERRKGKGAWKAHSKTGFKSGINWNSVAFRL